MRRALCLVALFLTAAARADDPKPNTLTPQEIANGWILLFDGETTFGLKTEGDVKVLDGTLALGGEKVSAVRVATRFPIYHLNYEASRDGRAWEKGGVEVHPGGDIHGGFPVGNGNLIDHDKLLGKLVDARRAGAFFFQVAAGERLRLRNLKLQFQDLKPIFNGKDLSGWKVYKGDEKRAKSEFSVTKDGYLHMKSGPGDLQTEGQYDDFVLQLECRTNGKGLNSGVFFRCLPDQYQNGYEMQIHNVFKDGDRTKPSDFGSGAIYRRIAARKVVAEDKEWCTLTLVAQGKRLRTWVNGYPTVDWTDERPPHENPRNGSKIGKGHISLQGHDPTTDVDFRNIRIAEMKPANQERNKP